ncbi:MAG: hypothetical protein Q9220_002201 [cf. Caloplaca sp. 1 TL-2023]
MDVDDVSHVGQWLQLLEKQKIALQAASKRKGEQPKDRRPRGHIIQEFMLQSASTSQMYQKKDQHMIHQSWVASPYLPSVALFESLKKIYLKDLYLETHHRGSYLLLRVATPPMTMTAVMAVMDDEEDDGVLLQLYQQEDKDHRPGEEEVRKGRVCIVKEPYYKVMNDGGYGLRVDHLSDIIWRSPDDKRIPLGWRAPISKLKKTAETLKEEGNRAVKVGELNVAIESYTLALHHSDTCEMSQILKLNRSLVNLKLRRYDEALEDVGELTGDTQISEKGFYRAALSLYGLERFQECHQKEILRTKQRLREQEYGDYDFKAMYSAAKDSPPCLNNVTFVDNVEVRVSNGRGRGLFTTKDVIAGELLLCEKAFSYCSSQHSKTSLLINTHTNRSSLGTQADLITATAQKMFRNPSLGLALTSLYHRDYKPVNEAEIDGMPVIDTFLIDRIISLNRFGCPRTSLESHISQITLKSQDQKKSHHTCGIFIKASYINHSCCSNARRSFIGDMQIVRATRNIPAGSEIFFWYAVPGPSHTYEKTQEKLENWGFQCACAMCQQSKKTKKNVLSRRLALLKDFEAAFGDRTIAADLPQAERLLEAIEKTYSAPAKDVPRLALWEHYLLLTRIYSSKNQQDKVIEMAWKVIISLGFTVKRHDPMSLKSPFEVEQWGSMTDSLIKTWVYLWTAYAQVAPDLCKKAEEYAKITYKICVGEDLTFDEKYGKLAHQAIFEGVDLDEAFQSLTL